MIKTNTIIQHDVTKDFPLPDSCIDVVITSPPYWGLRDYGVDGQIGLEKHPQEYIDKLVGVCREIKRVLKKSGSFYLNLGDTYCGSGMGTWDVPDDYKSKQVYFMGKGKAVSSKVKNDGKWLQPKQLMLIPVRVAIALQDDGWVLRNDIIWHKPNPMPSSVKDRLNNTFEHVFHFVKSKKYYYDLDAIREPHKSSIKEIARQYCTEDGKNIIDGYRGHSGGIGFSSDGKNPGDFWDITTQPFTSYSRDLEHFAVFPKELIIKPLKASCPMEICKKCGKPRIKIIEKEYFNLNNKPKSTDKLAAIQNLSTSTLRCNAVSTIVGWDGCNCNAGFSSGVVLDPFCGRGTVGRVAKELGLNYVLFDISPDYCELARLYVNRQKRKLIKNQRRLET